LKSQGCEKFVFDVRYNLGGNVSSVGAVLSYFLNEGDVYIRVKDKSGNIQSDVVREVTSFEGDYAGCNVSKADIGKYKGLDVVVLCNEYTASAGELFVATFKDYGLGKIVGNTTYGKGKIQTVYYLEQYALYQYGISGVGGAIKLTTGEYYSAKSDSYDGIGIEPNEKVMLSDEAENLNIYDYQKLDPIDDQLLKAINILNG
jgi:carboxyl-terminal processing protease